MKDITIGQYYPTNSMIHQLDPRVKLLGALIFIISLFMTDNFIVYGVITIFIGIIIKMSKIPFRTLMKGLKGILILLIISAGFNLFIVPGNELIRVWIFKITDEGIKRAIFLGIRLIYLVIGTSLMTLTTTPNDLADGLEKAFRPLNKIKIPVHDITMMMSIALRFIPILMEETDKIMKAQKARGADFETGGIIKKAKSLIPLLVPLFVSAIRRAVDLAMAMESRCYQGGEGRTKMKPLKYTFKDKVTYLTYAGFLFFIYFLNRVIVSIDVLSILSI